MQKRVRALEKPPPPPGGSAVADMQCKPRSTFFGHPCSPRSSPSSRTTACNAVQNRAASASAQNSVGKTANAVLPLERRARHVGDDSPPSTPVLEVINLVTDSDVPEGDPPSTTNVRTGGSAVPTQEIIIISDSEDTLENGGLQDKGSGRVSVSPSRPIDDAVEVVQENGDRPIRSSSSTARGSSSVEKSKRGGNVASQLGYSARVPEEGDDEESDDDHDVIPLSQLYKLSPKHAKKSSSMKPVTPVTPLDETLFTKSKADKTHNNLDRFWRDSSESDKRDDEEDLGYVTPPQLKSRPRLRRLRRTIDWSSSDEEILSSDSDDDNDGDGDYKAPPRHRTIEHSPLRRSPRLSQLNLSASTRKSPRLSQATEEDAAEPVTVPKTLSIAGVIVSDDSGNDEKDAERKSRSRTEARLPRGRASPRLSPVKRADRLRALQLLGYVAPPSPAHYRRGGGLLAAASAAAIAQKSVIAAAKESAHSQREAKAGEVFELRARRLVVSDGAGEETEEPGVEASPLKRARVAADDSGGNVPAQPSLSSSESESEPRPRTAQDDLDDERAAQVKEEMRGVEVPRGLQDPIICYICRLQRVSRIGTPRYGWRDGYIQPANNFSVNVQKGIYGIRMKVPYCLMHTAGDQNKYIQQLESHVETTQGEAEEEPSPGPRATGNEEQEEEQEEHSEWWRSMRKTRMMVTKVIWILSLLAAAISLLLLMGW